MYPQKRSGVAAPFLLPDRKVIFLRAIELTPRLMALARQVPSGARFADVGTDHARLPVWLLEQGVIDHAIASDLREGPLARAQRTAARHGVTDRVSFRLGGGLAPLAPGEADVVAIAGMGGETIAAILAEAPWIRAEGVTFLLQSMTSTDALRRWLDGHGWSIQRETLVREEGTIYVVLTVRFGAMVPLTPGEIWVGRQMGNDPLWGEYLALMTARAEKALEGIRQSSRSGDGPKRVELELLCEELCSIKKECDLCQT